MKKALKFGLATVAAYEGSSFSNLPDASPPRRLMILTEQVPGTLTQGAAEAPKSVAGNMEMQPLLPLESVDTEEKMVPENTAAPPQEAQDSENAGSKLPLLVSGNQKAQTDPISNNSDGFSSDSDQNLNLANSENASVERCAICREDLLPSQPEVKPYLCDHAYHKECLRGHTVDRCPLCREGRTVPRSLGRQCFFEGRTLLSCFLMAELVLVFVFIILNKLVLVFDRISGIDSTGNVTANNSSNLD